ncbi:extracellular solute-binding protein [Thermostichus vulcanus]|uniref:Extracellular solute-binding protein n=1 Tax=Thermostichus vulcanus str. 'Rupite' TaxID=2813851 RepID=A0ABT0CAM6_THEVL|nr:extracellular solute-binding protein [Thermostichus vulcanus]MCJ2542838.1 extracellular solute-binding protein [Thermostichus vulcanus str. 'Rupite']
MNTRRTFLAVVAGLVAASGAAFLAADSFAQSPTDVKVWIAFTDNRLDWAREKAAEFNEQFPQYNVTVEGYGNYEEIQQATDLAIQQNAAPAVVQWFEVGTQRARDFGYFKSIADALGDRTEVNGIPVDFDDFIEPVVSYYTLDGKFTSMPWNSSSPILYSNTAILEKAGIDTPPATWQEVEAACEKIMALPDAPQGCITWPNHGWFYEQWMAQQDAVLANNGNGREGRATELFLDSEPSIAIASWWQSMEDQGYYVYSGRQRDWAATEQAIQTGTVAMAITSSADAANITNAAKENNIDIVTTRMPYNAETGWTGNLIGGASLWLVKDLPKEVEEGALSFMLWLNNTENAAEWHQVTGYLPIRESSVKLLESQGWFEENPNFYTASDQINNSTVTTATRGALLGPFPQIRDVITQTMEDLMLKGGDPAQAMAQANQQANQLLAEYNSLYN